MVNEFVCVVGGMVLMLGLLNFIFMANTDNPFEAIIRGIGAFLVVIIGCIALLGIFCAGSILFANLIKMM